MSEINKTSHTLLARALNYDDEAAQAELYSTYVNFIYFVLREMKASDADIDDIAQKTAIKLIRDLKNYDRSKGKFRSWLKVVIKNTALMHFRQHAGLQKKLSFYHDELNKQSADAGGDAFELLIEREWKQYIYKLGLERVDEQFRGQAVEVFQLAMQGMATSEIAEHTKLTPNSVQTLRNRVKKALMHEVNNLIEELER